MTDAALEDRPISKSIRPLLMLVPFITPYWRTLVLALVALLLSSAAVLLMPMAVRDVIDQGFSSEAASQIDQYFFVLMGFAVLIGVFGAARAYFVNWLGERVVADLRNQVFSQVLAMDMKFFESTKVGEVLSRLTTDTTLIQSISGVGLSIVLRSSIQFLGALVLLGFTNLKLTLMLLVLLPAVIAPVMIIGRWVRKLSRDSQDRIADASGQAGEMLNAVQTVQMFTAEPVETARFEAAVESSFTTAVARIKARALLTTVAMTGLFGAFIVVLWVGARAVLAQEITGGELGQFVIYAVLIGASGGALIEFWGELQRAAGAMERLGQLLLLRPEVVSPEAPETLVEKSPGRLELASVSFSYPSRPESRAIKDLSLTIEPGEQIAVVGPSGAGKSTVFQLLLRMYDPQSGQIKIDGIGLRQLSLKTLRQFIGIVPQDTVIFGVSAKDNIRFGAPEATDAAVIQAAKIAHAHDFLAALPEGYDTRVSTLGGRLSGGQIQRIGLARALYDNPVLLVLDEPNSNLDNDGTLALNIAIRSLKAAGGSVLIMAHRPAAIQECDLLLVIEDGMRRAFGPRDQVLKEMVKNHTEIVRSAGPGGVS